jgi:hypothetical protein
VAALQPSISELCDAYKEARGAILQDTSELEQEIGKAALRVEATHTYRELTTTARSLSKDDLAPLREYVENLTGGERIEASVAWLDAQAEKGAKKVLSSITSSLLGGVAVGALTTILGLFTAFSGAATDAGEAIGASIIPLLLAGGSVGYLVVRTLYYAGQAGGQATSEAWIKSWGWADALGRRSDAAIGRARELQAAIWRSAVGAPWTFTPFTNKARLRAQLLVGAAWALIGLGALFVALGVYQALDAYAKEQTQVPTLSPPSPAPLP